MSEREWLPFIEALAWMTIHVMPEGLSPLSQNEACRLLREAAADGKVRLRSAWGQIPTYLIEPLRYYQVGPDGSHWFNSRFLNPIEMQGLLQKREDRPAGWPCVTVSRHDLETEFSRRGYGHSLVAGASAVKSKNAPAYKKRGRKPIYDWPLIERKTLDHFDAEGFELNADIERYMADFAQERHGRQPAPSLVREHTGRVIEMLRQRKAGN